MRRIEKRGVVNVLCDDDGNGCMPATRAEIEFYAEITRLRAEVDALRENNHGWLRANGPGGWIDALRADAALKRDLLLWALYHAQGGSSRVGQAIRRHLGIEQHARLTPEQIKDAERAAQGASDATN